VTCLDDDTVVRLLAGALAEAARAEIEAHVDDCVECRELVAALADEAAVVAPPVVGRYQLGALLGSGGMGEVYEAHDPVLGRRVAVKVVRASAVLPGQAAERDALLAREAQVMAKLAHPAVIQVFDAGVDGERAFVAMEIVRGQTLAAWLAAAERTWPAVVTAFVALGRGLAAAHAAGVVHGDVSPNNALVTDGGAWKVSDFGLARLRDERGGPRGGTRAFAAPEQLRGEPADARSDQYAFATMVRTALADRRVPARLTRAITRARAEAPAARWPTLDALLDELTACLAGRQRRQLVAISASAAVATGAVVLALAMTRASTAAPAVPCLDAPLRLTGVWDREQRAAFVAAAQPATQPEALRVAGALDAYATAWADARTNACEATHVHRVQSPALLDARMACLDERLAELAVVGALARNAHTRAELDAALTASVGLTKIASCADVRALGEQPAPPPALAAQAAALHTAIGTGRGQLRARDLRAARATGEQVAKQADALALPGLAAEGTLLAATAANASGAYADAEAGYREAARLAARGAADRTAAQAWLGRGELVGHRLHRLDDGARDLDLAADAVARAGDPPLLRAQLQLYRATHAVESGNFEAAAPLATEALAIAERTLPAGDVELVPFLTNVGVIERLRGKLDASTAALERGLAIREATLGPDHLDLAASLLTIGALRLENNDATAALVAFERAEQIRRRSLGDRHADVAAVVTSIGIAQRVLGHLDAAAARHHQAIEILTAVHGAEHPAVAGAYTNLGNVELDRDHLQDARTAFTRALAIHRAQSGDDHPSTATAWLNLGELERTEGNCTAARTAYEHALAIREQRLGRDHADLAYPLFGLAACARGAEAIRYLERMRTVAHDVPKLASLLAEADTRLVALRRGSP
jgi:tetratricopeptide (TPR) repeat protein